MLLRCQRRGAGTAVVPGDEHHVGVCLGHARCNGAHAVLGDQLDVHARRRVRVLQVVDQLSKVLDGVDVVVRRRRDEADTGRGVPYLGHPRVHLVPRKLAALTGFRTLGHLDLDVGAVRQVVRGDAEPRRGDLLDRAAAPIAVGVGVETIDVLTALTAVGPAADPVHRDGERLVRFGGDRAVAHRAGREAFDDLTCGLHLVQRNRRAHITAELEQSAQRCHPLALVVDQTRVLLEDLVLAGPGGVLEPEYRLRIEQVVFALAAPLVIPTHFEFAVRALIRAVQVGQLVPNGDVGGDVVHGDPAGRAGQPGEVLV